MKNMGLRRLTLVEPPEGLDDRDTRAPAYHAWDVLDAARVVDTLPEAVAGATLVVGTTGRADVPGTWTPRQLAAEAEGRVGGGDLAVVFGPEASGLSTPELGLCHALVHARTDEAQPSINLAQAVLLVAYELRLASGAAGEPLPPLERAPTGEMEQALADLRVALLDVGLSRPPQPRPHPQRAAPAHRPGRARRGGRCTLLRGLARQVGWAGRIARGGHTAP